MLAADLAAAFVGSKCEKSVPNGKIADVVVFRVHPEIKQIIGVDLCTETNSEIIWVSKPWRQKISHYWRFVFFCLTLTFAILKNYCFRRQTPNNCHLKTNLLIV